MLLLYSLKRNVSESEMRELDKVNFKEVKASKELENCEVARLVGVMHLPQWAGKM